jgi:hypothetical protein
LPANLGATAAIIRAWHPIVVNGQGMFPQPNDTQDGAQRGRIGTLLGQLVYSDGQATNFSDGGTEQGLPHTYPNGTDAHYHIHLLGGTGRRARMPFKVSRGTRTVDGVALLMPRRATLSVLGLQGSQPPPPRALLSCQAATGW